MKTYAFIDASNLFYGGRKSLGWSIDYEKLLAYLKKKYDVEQVYFFGGVEVHRFPFDYLAHESVPIDALEQHLSKIIKENSDKIQDVELRLVTRHLKRVHFFQKLEKFGYTLFLKPVKTYGGIDGNLIRKANCDVDMTLALVIKKDSFDRAVILSGDGDFLPVLKYLRENSKDVLILSRGPRTAKEIKRFAGSRFLDFEYLRTYLEYEE